MTVCSNALHTRPPAERIALVRLGAFGDVSRTLPAASALRSLYPAAHISWIVEGPAASAARLSPAIDELLVVPRADIASALARGHLFEAGRLMWSLARRLRAGRFDLVVDFHGILRSAIVARLTGARRRVTYARPVAREGAWLLATEHVEIGSIKQSRYERNAAAVEYLTGRVDRASSPLRREGETSSRGGVGAEILLQPGTSTSTPYKRWPAERYAQLARRLAAQTGRPCLIGAGPAPSESTLADQIERASEGAAVRAPRTGSAAELVALFGRCAVVIGSDSGPLHLAALAGTPVVQIVGPTDPIENRPFEGTPSLQVQVPQACSPCRRGCPEAHCMRAVSVDAVEAAARRLLEAGPGTVRPWRAA